MQRQSTGIRNLQLKEYKEVDVPFPSLSEQKRIVAILDQAFADIDKARANAEQNLKNARELFESCLNSRLFRVCSKTPSQTLSCITEFIVDCEHKTAPTQTEGFPSIRTPNIGKGDLILENVKRVSKETYDLWTKRAVPKPGDLILAREAPAGNVGVVPDGQKVCLGQRTVLIRPTGNEVDSKYLAYLLLHPIMQDRFLAFSTGATVQHVNMKDIRQLAISELPSIREQREDVNVLLNAKKKIAQLERIYLDKLRALDELKKSILQKAFVGELTQSIDTKVPEFSANVIALAHYKHAANQRDRTFGHVKAQKILHLTESIACLDLGRNPIRDAAGLNDSDHMGKAKNWAKHNQFFEFVERTGGGYDFIKLDRYDKMMANAITELKPYREKLSSVINLLVNKNKIQAEVFTTVHAAWNNLIIDGADINDEAIILAARDHWHADKLNIPKKEFQEAIEEIHSKQLVPDGSAKYVGGQGNLFEEKAN